MTSSEINRTNYNTWSKTYDATANPTVAIDEMFFPKMYCDWKGFKVLEIGCGTGRHTKRFLTKKMT